MTQEEIINQLNRDIHNIKSVLTDIIYLLRATIIDDDNLDKQKSIIEILENLLYKL